MWNKIFMALLAVSLIVMSAVGYLTRSKLQSIGFDPRLIVAAFESYSSVYWGFLGVSFVVLLVIGNVILWKFRTSWALWTSLAFFAVFVLLKSFWLSGQLYDYETEKGLAHSALYISYFTGVLLCAASAAAVFFDHFLVLRMRDKIYGEPSSADNKNAPLSNENKDLPAYDSLVNDQSQD